MLDIPDEEEDDDELEGIDEEQNNMDQPERDSKMSGALDGGESMEMDGENRSANGGAGGSGSGAGLANGSTAMEGE